jgi:hypothetical protein
MIEILKYIFSSFWIFLGTAILIEIIFEGIALIIKTLKE